MALNTKQIDRTGTTTAMATPPSPPPCHGTLPQQPQSKPQQPQPQLQLQQRPKITLGPNDRRKMPEQDATENYFRTRNNNNTKCNPKT